MRGQVASRRGDAALAMTAEWAANWELSASACEAAGDAVTDTIACAIAGRHDVSTEGVRHGLSSTLSFSNIAFGENAMPSTSALLLGTASHALDFDDSASAVLGHASAVLVPALLALCIERNLGGEQLAAAYTVGIEVQELLGQLANPGHYAAGWHTTSTLCALGSAAGAARLIGLDSAGIRAAMSVAFSMIGGSKRQFGTSMKPVHAGLAARTAVEAALLAEAGIAGESDFLGLKWGFFDLFVPDGDMQSVDLSAVTSPSGLTALERGTLNTKRFPSCAATHRTLDALREMMTHESIPSEAIISIEARIPATLAANLRFDRPENAMQARFSMPYCARRLIRGGGRLRLRDFTTQAVEVAREECHPTVRLQPIEGVLPEAPAETRVTLASGTVVKCMTQAVVGGPIRPLDAADRQEKFEDCWDFGQADGSAERAREISDALCTSASVRAQLAALAAEVDYLPLHRSRTA